MPWPVFLWAVVLTPLRTVMCHKSSCAEGWFPLTQPPLPFRSRGLANPPVCSCGATERATRESTSESLWLSLEQLPQSLRTKLFSVPICRACWGLQSYECSSWCSWISFRVANKDITGIFQSLIFAPWQPAQNRLVLGSAVMPPFLPSENTRWMAWKGRA